MSVVSNVANDYITFTIEPQKNIALIAHDNMKPVLIKWCPCTLKPLVNMIGSL